MIYLLNRTNLMGHDLFLIFDTLVNSNRPQDKRFRGTRCFLGHIDRVPRGLTIYHSVPDTLIFVGVHALRSLKYSLR